MTNNLSDLKKQAVQTCIKALIKLGEIPDNGTGKLEVDIKQGGAGKAYFKKEIF